MWSVTDKSYVIYNRRVGIKAKKKRELDWYYFFSGEDSKFYMEPSTRYYDFDNHNFKR